MAEEINNEENGVNQQDENGNTELHRDIGDLYTAIQTAYLPGTDINLQNNDGNTPSHLATAIGDVHLLMFFTDPITRYPDININ